MDAADPDCCRRARRCAPNGRSARVAPTSTKSRKPRLVSEPRAWLPLWTTRSSQSPSLIRSTRDCYRDTSSHDVVALIPPPERKRVSLRGSVAHLLFATSATVDSECGIDARARPADRATEVSGSSGSKHRSGREAGLASAAWEASSSQSSELCVWPLSTELKVGRPWRELSARSSRRLGAVAVADDVGWAVRTDLRHRDPRSGALPHSQERRGRPSRTTRARGVVELASPRERLGLARFADRRVKLSPDHVCLVGNL